MVAKIKDSGGGGGLIFLSILLLLLLLSVGCSSGEKERRRIDGEDERNCSFDGQTETLICSVDSIRAKDEDDDDNGKGGGGTDSHSSLASASHASRLRITCRGENRESSLRSNHFGYLPNLDSLELISCHFRHIPSLAFSGLNGLKRLTLRSASSASSTELALDSLKGPDDLRQLDLSDNSIWTLPRGLLCPLHGLSALNLSRNFLQDVSELGFSESSIAVCRLPLEKLDLSSNSIGRIPNRAFGQLGDKLHELDMSGNNLHLIEDGGLDGLGGLRRLDLSGNQLVAVPHNLFHTENCCKRLTELNLQNNSLSGLAPGLFDGLEHLLILNLSRNSLSDDWLKAETFASLMRLVALDLSHNRLAHLDRQLLKPLTSLQLLDLSNNRFKSLPGFAFANQFNLHSLKLSHNMISALDTNAFSGLSVLGSLFLSDNRLNAVRRDVLRNNTGLMDLDLSGNFLSRVPTEALSSLAKLKTLDLARNAISQPRNGSLTGLRSVQALSLAENGIAELSGGIFNGAANIKVLNLSGNKISRLTQNIFKGLKKLRLLRLDSNELEDVNGVVAEQEALKWLNMSSNKLLWFDYAFIPLGLKWLDISGNKIEDLGNYYKIRDKFELKYMDAGGNKIRKLEPLSLPNSLETGIFSSNRIRQVDQSTFADKSNIRKIDLTGNSLSSLHLNALAIRPNSTSTLRKGAEASALTTEIFLGGNPFICDCEMEWIQRINHLTHPLQRYPKVADLNAIKCRFVESFQNATGTFSLASELRMPVMQIHPDQFLCQYQAHCFALCKCCDFFACDCRMQCPQGCSCFHDATWAANVIQCSNQGHLGIPPLIPMDATAVHLDGNKFPGTLISQAFIGRKKIRQLFLNGSQIEAINNQTFNGLTELRVLHLENNLIVRLGGHEFGNMTSLRELYLGGNLLEFISDRTFDALKALVLLDLSANRLTDYPVWDLRTFPSLSKVFLAGNEWSCACDFVQKFKDFAASNLIADMSQVQCGGEINFLSENVTCSDAMAVIDAADSASADSQVDIFLGVLPIIIAAAAGAILIVCVIVLAFVFRTPLRVWLHSKYGIRVLENKSNQGNKLYDSFVAYSLKDDDFVRQILVPQLEHDEPSYKLCLQHRDLPTTSAIADTFPGMSRLCSKHLFIVTKQYLDSEWREIKFAIRETKKLKPVIILLEEFSSLDLAAAPEFNVLLKSSPVIRWSEPGFWNKVRFFLPDPRFRSYRRSTMMRTGPGSASSGSTTSGGGNTNIALHSSPKPPSHLYAGGANNVNGTVAKWHYDNLLSNNSSSTSTRSVMLPGTTTLTSSPRALSSTSGGSSSSSTEAVLSTPSHRNNNAAATMGNIVPNPLWQHQQQQQETSSHTYQTIEPIYHTLEPRGGGESAHLPDQLLQQQYDTLGRLDVMLPNGQMVPATLVRNAGNGRLVPLVEVNTGVNNSGTLPPPQQQQQQQQQPIPNAATSTFNNSPELNFSGRRSNKKKNASSNRHFV